jgi:hypothetical protein
MQAFDIRKPGPWFGSKTEQQHVVEASSADSLEIMLLAICHRLKKGDWTATRALEEFYSFCTDGVLRRQAMRLYCYVATHNDIAFFGKALEKCDYDEVLTFVSYAPHTLSPEVLPYLFSLLEGYINTDLEAAILTSIDRLFPFGYEEKAIDFAEVKEIVFGLSKSLELGKYCFDGKQAFAGDLRKNLITAVIDARHRKIPFYQTELPTLLSIWSGEMSPVFYGGILDDFDVQRTIDYVKAMSRLSWVHGCKYFYGNSVA